MPWSHLRRIIKANVYQGVKDIFPKLAEHIRAGQKGVVGETGFEPATSCSQSKRATGLRHSPSAGALDGVIAQVYPADVAISRA